MTFSLSTLLLRLVPKRLLSSFIGIVADSRYRPLKNFLCRLACQHYGITLEQAQVTDVSHYASFNDFFTRRLLPIARPIATQANVMVSPADGVVSALGKIEQQQLVQTKKHRYSVARLLQDETLAHYFDAGHFATIYLSPKDYHRVHMPIAGKLLSSHYIKGQLFAVNETSVNSVKDLFAINERCVCRFQATGYQFVLIFVGAILVNGIRLNWQVGKPRRYFNATEVEQTIQFDTGDELGIFASGQR